MHFNLNDLSILEHSNHIQKTWKGDFFKTQNNLGKSQPFRLKSSLNAEIMPYQSHTTKAFPRNIDKTP